MKCNIARDLFPLYFDGLCSDDTKKELEEHLEHCESCRQLKQSLEQEAGWIDDNKDWNEPVLPLKKLKKKMRRKNLLIGVCVLFLLLFAGATAVLTYGQITKTGVSFELIYDAIRFQNIGEEFASGNIEPLYENLSTGFMLWDEESAVTMMLYMDEDTYNAEMKEAIMAKYHQYFDGKNLTYRGIEEISYFDSPDTWGSRTIYISLKFEGMDEIEYYITLYKSLDEKYLVSDYFGNPYLSYTSYTDKAADEEKSEYVESYHTDDSLFSCLPNRVTNSMIAVAQQIIRSSGQRALQGDTTLAGHGQMRLSIKSEQDMTESTNFIKDKMNQDLDELTKWDYYVTNILLNVKGYDRTKYLYQYQMDIELTNKNGSDSIIVSLDCYRIREYFVYITGSDKIYGENLPPEVLQILEGLFEYESKPEDIAREAARGTAEETARGTTEDTVSDSLSVLMVGDILLHTPVEESALQSDGSYDFTAIFANVKSEIEAADVAIVNQEVILGGEELGISGYPAFNAPYEAGDALADAGFDVICHATNHALDKGKRGITNCLGYWQDRHPDMAVLGIYESEEAQDEIYVCEQNGIRIAVLNYTYGTNGIALPEDMPYAVNLLEEEQVRADLQAAEELADFTIVCPHWGTEYSLDVSESQRKWARIFLEGGADLVLGTHPHVIEPIEWVRDEEQDLEMLVYYSLGNFVNWTSGTGAGVANRMVGGMAQITLERGEDGEVSIADYGVTPLVCHVEEGTDGVTVYALSDYTEELAERNAIVGQDSEFSLEYCEKLCEEVFSTGL